MLLSPSSEGFGLWGDYFSGLLCVHCSLRPDDLLTILKMALSIDERFGFPVSLYPSYEVLTFTSVGLPPIEHISLSRNYAAGASMIWNPRFAALRLR